MITAYKAYQSIKDKTNNQYRTDVCREYRDMFVFPHGGINVFLVNKETGEVTETEMYDVPKGEWMSVYF